MKVLKKPETDSTANCVNGYRCKCYLCGTIFTFDTWNVTLKENHDHKNILVTHCPNPDCMTDIPIISNHVRPFKTLEGRECFEKFFEFEE